MTFEFCETPGEELMQKGSALVGKALRENFINSIAFLKLDTDFVYYKIQRLFSPVLKAEEYKC